MVGKWILIYIAFKFHGFLTLFYNFVVYKKEEKNKMKGTPHFCFKFQVSLLSIKR